MNFLIEPLACDAYAVAILDKTTWDVMSYTNVYILKRPGQVILIDCGLASYHREIKSALDSLGLSTDQVTHILFTHGHRDHTEGCKYFANAKKYIHQGDWALLSAEQRADFTPYIRKSEEYILAAQGLDSFTIIHVNTHSPGSVAIYDQVSKALFVGDFFCYFGEELPEGKLVAQSDYVRKGSCEYVAAQTKEKSTESAHFSRGLSRLLSCQADFFCTGHGFVLQDNIHSFLNEMWQSAT